MIRRWLFPKQKNWHFRKGAFRLAWGAEVGAGIKGRSEAVMKSTRIVTKDKKREVGQIQMIWGLKVMLRNVDFIASILGNQTKNLIFFSCKISLPDLQGLTSFIFIISRNSC